MGTLGDKQKRQTLINTDFPVPDCSLIFPPDLRTLLRTRIDMKYKDNEPE